MKIKSNGALPQIRAPHQQKMRIHDRCHDDVSLSALDSFRDALGLPRASFESVLSEKIDPSLFSDYREFLPAYWAVESFSKMPLDIGIDRQKEAIAGFLEAEHLCIAATPRLVNCFLSSNTPDSIRRIFSKARGKLRWLLSGISPLEVMKRARWSTGATSSLPKTLANPQNKWGLATHMTSGTTFWMQSWNSHFRDQAFRNWEVVDSNRVLTVPKNAKTDRVIAAEPDWSMFFQLGMGACIRRRLQRVGLLKDPRAGERETIENSSRLLHQYLARVGSRDGTYATIDLKGASDSISLAICDLLLPPDLFRMLCHLRSPKGELPDGSTVTYEKISSMGNGYTFELETALFWALASAASDSDDVSVFGDDIITRTGVASRVIDTLEWAGFQVNHKKTHISGPFRESCGGHYFNGTVVTPPYFRNVLNRHSSIISAYNSLCLRVASEGVSCTTERALMDGVGNLLRSKVPKQLYGPPGLDGCLGVPFNEFIAVSHSARKWINRNKLAKARGIGHLCGLRFVKTSHFRDCYPEWGLIHALYGSEESSRYPSGDSFKVQTWSSEPWSTTYPY